MPDSSSDGPMVEVPRSLWAGRLDFDLLNGRGWRVAYVEIVIRLDFLTLWSGNRTLAVMGRDLFGQWLFHPDLAFEIDDVAWSVQGAYMCLTLDGSRSYVVPAEMVEQLRGVI